MALCFTVMFKYLGKSRKFAFYQYFNDLKAFLYFICKIIYYLTFKTG